MSEGQECKGSGWEMRRERSDDWLSREYDKELGDKQ